VFLYCLVAYAFGLVYSTATRAQFEQRINALLCGDDSFLSISPAIRTVFTAEHIVSAWLSLGIVVKEVHQSSDKMCIEYCGATSASYGGVLVRYPRVDKFLASLYYTRDTDPTYLLLRAASIMAELFPAPEAYEVVRGYVESLFVRFPYLESLRQSIKTDGQIAYLHTGLERYEQCCHAARNEERMKNNMPRNGNSRSRRGNRRSRAQPSQRPRRNTRANRRPARMDYVRPVQSRLVRRPGAQSRATPPHASSHVLHMSEHTTAYAKTLLDPVEAPPAGMPADGLANTRKVKFYARGSGSTGTAGYGYIICDPKAAVTNNQGTIAYSDATYAGTTMDTTTGSGGRNNVYSNSEYAAASFNAGPGGIQSRLVSAAIRTRFTGTELARGGSVYSLIEPNHQSLNGKAVSDIRGYSNGSNQPFDREWHQLNYTGPINSDEMKLDYATQSQFYMGILMQAPSTTPVSFDWEAWFNIELSGSIIHGKTLTMQDPAGFHAVTSGVQSADQTTVVSHGHPTFLQSAIDKIGDVFTKAATYIAPPVAPGAPPPHETLMHKFVSEVAPTLLKDAEVAGGVLGKVAHYASFAAPFLL
jgi:hypothetical protein